MKTTNGIAAGVALGVIGLLAWWLLSREPVVPEEAAAGAPPAAPAGPGEGPVARPVRADPVPSPAEDSSKPAAATISPSAPAPGPSSTAPGGPPVPGEKAVPPAPEESLPGDLAGRVLERGGRDLPPGVRVQIQINEAVPAGAGAWKAGKWVGARPAGEDGRFRFTGLAPGTYRLFVTPSSATFRRAQAAVEIPKGGFRDDLVIELDPCVTGKVRLVAKGPGGKPVEGAMLLLVSGSFTTSLHGTSPEAGVYVAEVEAGTVSIELSEKSAGSALVTVSVEEGRTVEAEARLRK